MHKFLEVLDSLPASVFEVILELFGALKFIVCVSLYQRLLNDFFKSVHLRGAIVKEVGKVVPVLVDRVWRELGKFVVVLVIVP